MSEPETLADVRSHIDELDAHLVGLLARRQDLVLAAARFKRDEDAVRAPGRVDQVIAGVRRRAEAAGLDAGVAEAVWRAMIASFIELELERHRRSTGPGAPASA